MIIKQEDLLRRYLMEKERYVSLLKTERGYFNELKTIVKESLRKVFNLDCYPIDKVLLTREQALYYIKNTILKEWDGSKFKVMSMTLIVKFLNRNWRIFLIVILRIRFFQKMRGILIVFQS